MMETLHDQPAISRLTEVTVNGAYRKSEWLIPVISNKFSAEFWSSDTRRTNRQTESGSYEPNLHTFDLYFLFNLT